MGKNHFSEGYLFTLIIFYFTYVITLSIVTQHNTKDQHQKAHRNIKIFTHRVKYFK